MADTHQWHTLLTPLQAQAEQLLVSKPFLRFGVSPSARHVCVHLAWCCRPSSSAGAAGLGVGTGTTSGAQGSQLNTTLSDPDQLAAMRSKRNNVGGSTSTGRKPSTPGGAGSKWPGRAMCRHLGLLKKNLLPLPPCMLSRLCGPIYAVPQCSQHEEAGCRQLSDRSPLRPHPTARCLVRNQNPFPSLTCT